ncbi:M16 family metallopeptidase [Archangium sp.]|uniref:M16 family metallopeptidase n=1 Tax=Archangium sp. TaxID=1872627 RepID=UPI00389A14F4
MWSRLLASGAEFNAFTTHDSTDYWFTAPPEQFPKLVDLEAQRLRDPLAGLTEEAFRVERDVVVAELRERQETSPEGAQFTWVLSELMPGHPYGRSVGGTPESVRGLTLEDVRAFVKQHYTPAHAVLVVSGPLAPEEVKFQVARGFSSLTGQGSATPTEPVQRTPPPLPPELAGMVTKSGPVDYPRLWMVWTVPGLYSGKTAQARAAAALLDAVIGQRLVRDERVHSSNAFSLELDGVTLLVATIDLLKAEDARPVASLAQDQLISLVTDLEGQGSGQLYTRAERATIDVRTRILTDAFLDMEQLSTPAVANFLRATGQPDYVGGWQKQVREGLASSLSSYLYEYLQRERTRMLLVVPAKASAGRTVVGEGFQALPGAEDFGRWDVPLPPGSHDVRRVAMGPGLDQAWRFTLPNGLKVVALRRGTLPVVEARLLVDTGLSAPGEAALGPMALYTSWHSAAGAWRHADKVGARVSRLPRDDHALVASSAGSGNLPHLLDDLREWVVDPAPDTRLFDLIQEWQVRQLERDAVRADTHADQALHARLYPGHAYGDTASAQQAKALTTGKADDWLSERLHPWNMTLFLVGDLPPDEELRRWVDGLLGSWGGSPPANVRRAAPARPELPARRTVVLVDRPGASQAVLQLGLRWPVLDAGEAATAEALTWLLDEHLQHQLREQLGLTYGVHVWSEERPLTTPLFIHTAVDAKAVAGALEQVLAELGSLEDTLLPQDVVERARWQVARGYDLRFRTTASVASRLVELERLGRTPDYWEKYPEHLAAVTPTSVRALVQKLSLGHEVVVITGDATVLEPQLTAAGFSVEVLAPETSGPVTRSP